MEGLSSTRIGQLLNLLNLDPAIIAVLDVPAESLPPGIQKTAIRKIALIHDHATQRQAFHQRWPAVRLHGDTTV